MVMKTLLFAVLAILVLTSAHAQITSTFDTDADGWTFTSVSTSIPVTHQPAGGNPTGYVSVTYSSNASATVQNWIAPAKFRGNQLVRSLGMQLKFDLQQSQAGTGAGFDVLIRNGGNFIYLSGITPKPNVAPAWSSYSFTLDETGGWFYSAGATVASRAQIKSILANVTSIEIRGTYATNAAYTSGLDNVVLEQRLLSPAPVATSISSNSGKPGDVITINGSGFNSTPSNNSVSFGTFAGTKAEIQSASTTQLTVVVPPGAVYGPITITNTVTGLTAKTLAPFNPVFDGGGRVIPASFKNRFSMATIDNEGWFVGDIDGDGWEDFGVANNNADDAIDIYRNLGLGGELSAASFAAKFTILVTAGSTNGAGLWFADLDGDGKLDVITSTSTGAGASFITFRNVSTIGNLAFETQEAWAGGSDETPIALVADLDGDGRPEIMGGEGAVCGCVRTDFWFNQNLSTPGDIEFSSAIGIYNNSVISGFAGAASGDLNNDGRAEVIVSSFFGDRFTVLQNTSTVGVPTFLNSFTIMTGQYNRSMRVVDVNLDGKNDLVWKKSGGGVYIRINTDIDGVLTDTDFATEFILISDLGADGGISIVDFNGDGKPDIAITDSDGMGVFENNFNGGVFGIDTFIPAYQVFGANAGSSTSSPVASDLNHDGKPDFLIAGNGITIVENKNVVGPQIAINTVSPLMGPVGSTVTITGNNFSTTPPLNKVYFGAVEATVLTSTVTELTVSVPPGATYAPVSVRVGELSSRYRLPFVTTFSSGVTFDNTHFAAPVNFTFANANYDIEVGDLNRDGQPDILAEANGGFAFRNSHLSGAITITSLIPDDTLSVNSFINPRLEDFDGDGFLDVASVNGLAHRNISTLTEISFQPSIILGLGASTMDMADFNNDGKTDITVTVDLSGTGDLVIKENRSNTGVFTTGTFGSFSSNFIYTKPAANGGVVAEDFDGDGFADIATTNSLTDNISIYHNAGLLKISNSQFGSRLDLAVGDSPGRIYKGDFDADGKTDLMLYHAGTNSALLTIFHNTSTAGNISFTRIDLTNPSATTVATVADLDGDGKPEIITTSETGNRFSIFKNIHATGALTAASFAAPFNTTVTAPRGITTGDLNLDGKLEIILTRAAGLLVVYENLIPTVSISITTQPTAVAVCDGATASFTTAATGTTTLAYQWQFSTTLAGMYTDINNGGGYSNAGTASLSVNTTGTFGAGFYRCRITGDLAATVFSNAVELTINAIPAAPTITNGSRCGAGSVTLSATGGVDGQYRWYTTATGGTALAGEVNSNYATPSLATTTPYFASINNGCESTRTAVSANVNPPPAIPTITSNITLVANAVTICSTTSLTLSAPNGFSSYSWSTGATTSQISVSTSGSYSVTVTDGVGCTSPASDAITVTIVPAPCTNSAPVINSATSSTSIGGQATINLLDFISDAENNLVLSSLIVLQQPGSGAVATISNGMLTINYSGISFTGKDQLTIQVCDAFGECTDQLLEIDVIGEIEIYNGLSPNDDDQLNPIFLIRYIDLLPDTQDNKVTIYNRWGSKVFETENYNNTTNVFRGLNDNGNELPSGTYFYKILFQTSGKTLNGYLVLKR